uniref:Mutator-like transposase domain-containing protein n=1 Tax=Clytia hemisphaerica TaxID=252671 RepID=A0A7M5UK02_9CNID
PLSNKNGFESKQDFVRPQWLAKRPKFFLPHPVLPHLLPTIPIFHPPVPQAMPLSTFSEKLSQKLSQEKTKVIYKPLKNKSAEKLRKGYLNKHKRLIRTRSQTERRGVRKLYPKKRAVGFKLIDEEVLMKAFNNFTVCKNCKASSSIEIQESENLRRGMCETLTLFCKSCSHISEFKTSPRSSNKILAYDVNIRSVYAAQQIGRAGLSKFNNLMELPAPVTSKPFTHIQNNLLETISQRTSKVLKDAADNLLTKTLTENPKNITVLDNGEIIADVSVIVDGTWQRRGHSSKIGVVFVISVETGEVLDYEVKSLFCHSCSKRQSSMTESDFQKWYETHAKECEINHKGSSDFMETSGAKEIFLRSIDKYNLKYTVFVGDGDSSCFGSVKEACEEVYGDGYNLNKEECVGHVQKRMGTRLRTYKKNMRGQKLAD